MTASAPIQLNKKMQEIMDADTSIIVDPTFDYLGINVLPYMKQTNKKNRLMFVHVDTVFETAHAVKLSNSIKQITVFGQAVYINSVRTKTFETNNKCVCCGIVGDVFVAEQCVSGIDKAIHWNLYARTKGGLALMSVDHILADSLGGLYSVRNFQTMCQSCNSKKGNMMSVAEIDLVLSDMDKYATCWVNKDNLRIVLDLLKQYHQSDFNTERYALNKKFLAMVPLMKRDKAKIPFDMAEIDRELDKEAAFRARKTVLFTKTLNVQHPKNRLTTKIKPGYIAKYRVQFSNWLSSNALVLTKKLYDPVEKKINPVGYVIKPGFIPAQLLVFAQLMQKAANMLKRNCYHTVKEPQK